MKGLKLKTSAIFLLATYLAYPLMGQDVALRLHIPPPGKLAFLQWWSVDVVNNSSEPKMLMLQGEIRKADEGLVIFRGKSKPQTFQPGITRVTPRDIQYDPNFYVNKDYVNAIKSSELPKGIYIACVYALNPVTQGVITSSCMSFTSIPITAPRLLRPVGGEKVSIPFPIFTWTYPPQPGYSVTFELKIVEVLPNQSPQRAIESNPPIHKASVSTNFYVYPPTAQKLERGKKYAWQIVMKLSGPDITGYKTVKSPVESFIYDPDV